MTLFTRSPISLTAFYAILVTLTSTVYGKTINVNHGQSIQAAINSANYNDRIVVSSGTYAEQLTISKDGISLIGHNAVLVPPPNPTTNTCSGLAGPNPFTSKDTQAGICITGTNVVLGTFVSEHRNFVSVGRRVRGVSVTGFTVKEFDGLNIAIVAAQDTSVTSNTLVDGGAYGALTVGSINSDIEQNTVISNPPVAPNTFLGFIGICMDDVNTVTVAYNNINGYNIALCVETDGANVHDNCVTNCCIGAFVDPGVNGARLISNQISHTNPLCREDVSVSGAFGVWGIVIAGAKNTLIRGNDITEISDGFSTAKAPAAGIAVFDDFTGATTDVAIGNTVEDNTIERNDVDLMVETNGHGNVEKRNQCKVSIPANLCKQ